MDKTFTPQRTTLLVLRAQSGDPEAIDQLLESCQGELFGYLNKMLRNEADAEDTLQSTLIQAVKKIGWLREPSQFRPWIFRIASRNAFHLIRKSQRVNEISNFGAVEQAAQPESAPARQQDLIDQIPKWLEHLRPKGREAIILHYLKGFTTEEVANITGIPLGTAKSRISYSLACIRRQINTNTE
ncbi:MAG: RNA polymerase sigma factor [Planctomycetota bacterium]